MRGGRPRGVPGGINDNQNQQQTGPHGAGSQLIPLLSSSPSLRSSDLPPRSQLPGLPSPQPTAGFTGFFSSRPFLSASASDTPQQLDYINPSSTDSPTTAPNDRMPHATGFVKTKQPLVALAASPSKDHVAVVGQDAINVLYVMNTERGVETKAHPSLMSGTKNLDYQFSDVTWAPKSGGNRIATASLNGAITLWDVERRCKERIIREQDRSATISFHTTEPLLASACRDGLVRVWDVRDNKTAQVVFDGRCGDAFAARINPAHKDIVIACYENSVVKWDLRSPAKWVAMNSVPHSGIVQTCEWHPDGHKLATAGKDKTIKVLDALQPYVPAMIFDIHKDVATSFLWYDSDTLWTCSRDKSFAWQDVRAAYKPRETLSTVAMGWGMKGELTLAIEGRGPRNVWCGADDFLKGKRSSRRPPSTATELQPEEHPGLRQKAAVLHTGTFDASTFTSLARRYKLDATDIWESCEFNARAAAEQDQFKAAQTWRVVQLLYGTRSIAPRNMAAMLMSKPLEQSLSPPTFDMADMITPLPILAEPDPWLRQAVTQPRPAIIDAILDSGSESGSDMSAHGGATDGSIVGIGVDEIDGGADLGGASGTTTFDFRTNGEMDEFIILGWDPSHVVCETLEYYASQGNVQMCVTLLHVLANKVEFAAESVELWTWSYLDLLRRFQLWGVAADVISSSRIPTIKEVHKEVTPIYTGCGECRKQILVEGGLGWMCSSCKRTVGCCSFCHRTVKTLYVWCQGCSHGGHLECLKSWFTEHHECCTGCGHQCMLHINSSN
ncbi:hypothetical protein SeLEV6574_g03942 [Synchytrium endobioticum]|uniref:Uncharacterized protein n=1 Tax=Synchytrium endobioticum TaxID=286115 RepID=A0A507D1I9_9FUNG|nr:hypothetical protein SeLEV6574_g03942 [Synchytrium endobioticum]